MNFIDSGTVESRPFGDRIRRWTIWTIWRWISVKLATKLVALTRHIATDSFTWAERVIMQFQAAFRLQIEIANLYYWPL